MSKVNLRDKVVNLNKSPVKRRLSESFIEKPARYGVVKCSEKGIACV